MPIEKNIPQAQQAQKNVPEGLALKKEKYTDAGYTYTFSPTEENYIKYNNLRNKRKDTEIVDVIKIYHLRDETEDNEYYVAYVNSKVKDFNNNLVKCPITEVIGIVDDPQTNQIKDQEDNVTDIVLVETHNHYYKEWNKEEVEELFKKSRNPGNIACYVGYCRNPKTGSNDFIDNKRYIKDQNAFMTKEFDEVMNLPDSINRKKQFQSGNKSKKQLKYSTVKTTMNTNQPSDIEKRVKDNGQLYEQTTEEITKAQQDIEKAKNNEGKEGSKSAEEETKTTKTTSIEEDNKNKPNLKVGSGSSPSYSKN